MLAQAISRTRPETNWRRRRLEAYSERMERMPEAPGVRTTWVLGRTFLFSSDE